MNKYLTKTCLFCFS